jgi:hypothetical protein
MRITTQYERTYTAALQAFVVAPVQQGDDTGEGELGRLVKQFAIGFWTFEVQCLLQVGRAGMKHGNASHFRHAPPPIMIRRRIGLQKHLAPVGCAPRQ